MKLFSYGDSWAAGVGTESEFVRPENPEELKQLRDQYCWGKLLSDKLNCEFVNKGVGASNNVDIFNRVCDDVRNGVIKSGDLVIVMWSSTLRDPVPFFPKNEWHVWSKNHIKSEKLKEKFYYFFKPNHVKGEYYNFYINYKEFFINNLFNQTYYNIINQNYIIFLQKLFSEYKINNLQCDAFDLMVQNVNYELDVTNHIDTKRYWNLGVKTFNDFLNEYNDNSLWEHKNPIHIVGGKHPSYKGYQLISEELFDYVSKNDLITFSNITTKDKFI